MTTWLLVLVPITALLIWAWVLDRKGSKLADLGSDPPPIRPRAERGTPRA